MISKRKTRSVQTLFEPIRAGVLKLASPIVMAPLTRNRAGPDLVPGPSTTHRVAGHCSASTFLRPNRIDKRRGQFSVSSWADESFDWR